MKSSIAKMSKSAGAAAQISEGIEEFKEGEMS